MNKEEFIKQNLALRVESLSAEGEVISEKVYYDCNITLFLLHDFYVELFFNRDLNRIVGAEVQDNPQILYNYIKTLDLSELENLLS